MNMANICPVSRCHVRICYDKRVDEYPALPKKPLQPRIRQSARVDELENELQATLKRYETIFRATHDVLYDLDFVTSKVVWNEALYTQYGYPEDEPAGTIEWWAGHIHPDDALGVEREITTLLETKQNNWNYEYRFRTASGSYVDVRDRGYILRSQDGSPQRIIGSFLDISHQKQLERAKDEFSSLISHQLRTPLTVIQIYSDLLADGTFGDLTEAQAREVAKIHSSSVKLIELVNDILAISSIELQRVHISPVLTDMNQLLTACIEAVQPLADQKSVSLLFTPVTTAKPLLADQKVLDQVLHNLLTNAIRYSPEQTGKVVIALKPEATGCVVSVTDNGIGIPVKDRTHIFERFYRANNAINTEAHGTGLGLYYVKLVADAFGGKVWFDTKLGKGTTFFVSIPLST
jgi:PAS domain S-box-containing protein